MDADDAILLEKLIRAARVSPSHEVGDLQVILRACWVLLPSADRQHVGKLFEGLLKERPQEWGS